MTYGASNTNNFPKQSGITLEDKAQRFGQSATDSLLVCVPKDWSRVKKKNATLAVTTTILYRNPKELKFYKCC